VQVIKDSVTSVVK